MSRSYLDRVLPLVLALVLWSAAILKAIDLSTRELDELTLLTSRWFVSLLILFEMALGIWLVAGWRLRWTRWLLVVTFVVFFEASLWRAVQGLDSCACLGQLSVPPWAAALFDAAVVLVLATWQPVDDPLPSDVIRRRCLLMAVTFAVAALPLVLTIVNYHPTGPMPSLRRDPALAKRVSIDGKDFQAHAWLEAVRRSTGISVSVDPRLQTKWPKRIGRVDFDALPAWAVMELMVQVHPDPVRWVATEHGYKLKASMPLGTKVPWLAVCAALFTMSVISLRTRFAAKAPV